MSVQMQPTPPAPASAPAPAAESAAAAPPAPPAPATPRRRFLRTFSSRGTSSTETASSLVLAATARSAEPPAEAHVRQILALLRRGGNTADRGTPVGAVLHRLRVRLAHAHWQVCLKALIVTHAILRGGPAAFVDYFAQHPRHSLAARGLKDGDRAGGNYAPFIRQYARYLKTWCDTRSTAAWPADRVADLDASMRFAEADATDLVSGMPKVANLVEAGTRFDARAGRAAGDMGLIHTATLMIVHDREVGSSCLRVGMKSVERAVFLEEKAKATQLVNLYEMLGGRGAMVVEMHSYVTGGCQERGGLPWVMAAERACEGNLRPAAGWDVERVVRAWQEGFGTVAIKAALERVFSEGNVVSTLKAQTLLLGVLRAGGGLEGIKMERVPVGPQADVHGELVGWLQRYLEVRQVRGGDAVEKLEGIVARGECLEQVPVGIGVRASPVSRRVYGMVVKEVAEVVSGVSAGIGEVVGIFFEEGEGPKTEGKERMVAVVEKAVELGRRERAGGGMGARVRVLEPRTEGVGEGGEGVLREMRVMLGME